MSISALAMAALLAAALQPSPGEVEAMARDFLGPERYSNRLDCASRSVRAGIAVSQSNLVFVFPIRPHRRNPEELGEVTYVRTMRDGRTWIENRRVAVARLEQWPHFSARIADGDGEIVLASDPGDRGRVTLRGRSRASHGPDVLEDGDCRFVPEIPTNEVSAR